MDKMLIKDVENTLEVLKRVRKPFEAQIDDILTYIYHGRRTIRNTTMKGQKTGTRVYDGTALHAVNLLTDGLTGYTISKSFNWFGHSLPHKIQFSRTSALRGAGGDSRRLDSFPEVKRYLQATEEVMRAAYLASNIYEVASEFVRDAATVGTVTITADEDIARGRTIFSVPHFRECFCAENYFGEVDTMIRERSLTLKQLVEKFGYEQMVAADPQFKQDYKKNRNMEREVIHARYPRRDYDPRKLNGSNKKFASVWVLKTPKKLLKDSGTEVQSFVTWRWRKNGDEWYGRSPAWDAYVDVMTANQMGRTNLIAGQKMAEPPMYGPSDLRGRVQRGPGGWTSIDNPNQVPRPLLDGAQLPFGIEMQDRIDARIKDHFNVDFFLMLSRAAMQNVELTATQVIEMGGEKAAVLGPRIGRMEKEALSPIHDIVFYFEQRAGRMPVPPDILQEYVGTTIEVEYTGPIAQAQKKLFRAQGIQQGLESIAGISQVFPEIRDLINPDETGKDLLSSRNFPQKDLNDEDTIKAIRQQRQQKAEQKEALDETIQTAKAMPAAGKEIHPNSAAGMLLGMNK